MLNFIILLIPTLRSKLQNCDSSTETIFTEDLQQLKLRIQVNVLGNASACECSVYSTGETTIFL